jgi:hypothetical protein
MTVDERLRAELTKAVEDGMLREDEAYDNVQLRHGRDLLRRRVARQTVTAAVVLSLFASAAMAVAWRNVPDRPSVAAGGTSSGDHYRSTATMLFSPAVQSGTPAADVTDPLQPADPRRIALTSSTVRRALHAARLAPDQPNVNFLATLEANSVLSLIVTAPSASDSSAGARAWASEFAKAWHIEDVRLQHAHSRALEHRVSALHERIDAIDAELKGIDPIHYANLGITPRYGFPRPGPTTTITAQSRPTTDHELKLANRRVQILAQLADIGALEARGGPIEFYSSKLIEQTPPVLIKAPGKSRAPVLVGGAIALIAVLGGALLMYRRRTRSTRQVAA